MNKNISVIMALGIVAVLAVGIAAISVTQSVLAVRAARNVGWGTDGDSGGNGGSEATGGTATSGAATGQSNTGADTAGGDGGPTIKIIDGTINSVGCGHIGGSASSTYNC